MPSIRQVLRSGVVRYCEVPYISHLPAVLGLLDSGRCTVVQYKHTNGGESRRVHARQAIPEILQLEIDVQEGTRKSPTPSRAPTSLLIAPSRRARPIRPFLVRRRDWPSLADSRCKSSREAWTSKVHRPVHVHYRVPRAAWPAILRWQSIHPPARDHQGTLSCVLLHSMHVATTQCASRPRQPLDFA